MVLVDFDRKNWVLVDFGRQNLLNTEQTGFGPFWPNKVVLADFDRKKLGFDQKKTGFCGF